jgi:hypothetical protein
MHRRVTQVIRGQELADFVLGYYTRFGLDLARVNVAAGEDIRYLSRTGLSGLNCLVMTSGSLIRPGWRSCASAKTTF